MVQNSKLLDILIFFVSLFIVYFIIKESEDNNYNEIEYLELENRNLKYELDSLYIKIDSLEKKIVFYEGRIKSNEIELVILEKERDEKIDSIISLSLDESVNFLSEYLSKEGDCGR